MKDGYADRVRKAAGLLKGAERVIIGGGSGLSAAAGLSYAGSRFKNNFADFIERYGMTDMYTAGFHIFATQEEKWAYWSRHVMLNRFLPDALPLYRKLKKLSQDGDCFVITTNVDYQFYKAGFSPAKIFAVQGDYGKLQCAGGCHDRLYDGEELIGRMAAEQRDCRIPSGLVPVCPVCGGPMEVNIRKDSNFVEDEQWRAAYRAYESYAADALTRKTTLLEIGVGFNTPTIIRFPFERMTTAGKDVALIRINTEYPLSSAAAAPRTLSFSEDAGRVIEDVAALM